MKKASIHLVVIALLSLTAISVMWPGLYGGFVFDDYVNIVDNTRFSQALSGHVDAEGLFSSGISQVSGRPISSASFVLNAYFDGYDPWYYKVLNLIIHTWILPISAIELRSQQFR